MEGIDAQREWITREEGGELGHRALLRWARSSTYA
jgi:hypothetical protein